MRIPGGSVDEDILDLWQDVVEQNREEIKELRKELKAWPGDCTEVTSHVRTACEIYPYVKRPLSSISTTDERELWLMIAELKKSYGGQAADTKIEDFLKLVFCFFKSGDTAEEHCRKVWTS